MSWFAHAGEDVVNMKCGVVCAVGSERPSPLSPSLGSVKTKCGVVWAVGSERPSPLSPSLGSVEAGVGALPLGTVVTLDTAVEA